jgi:hypothetical protein
MKKQTQTKKRQNRSRSRSKKYNTKSIKVGGGLRLAPGALYTILHHDNPGYSCPNVVFRLVRKVGNMYTFRSIYNPQGVVEVTREQIAHNDLDIKLIELPEEVINFPDEIIEINNNNNK